MKLATVKFKYHVFNITLDIKEHSSCCGGECHAQVYIRSHILPTKLYVGQFLCWSDISSINNLEDQAVKIVQPLVCARTLLKYVDLEINKAQLFGDLDDVGMWQYCKEKLEEIAKEQDKHGVTPDDFIDREDEDEDEDEDEGTAYEDPSA